MCAYQIQICINFACMVYDLLMLYCELVGIFTTISTDSPEFLRLIIIILVMINFVFMTFAPNLSNIQGWLRGGKEI